MTTRAQRSWISPFVAVTYAAVAITGILMLFHLKFPGIYPVHKWAGLVFVIGAAIHLVSNWQIFVSYFKKTKATVGMLIGILILIVIALAVPGDGHGHRHWTGGSSPNYGRHLK